MNIIELKIVNGFSSALRRAMQRHYSHPGGFVGRRIVYEVWCNNRRWGWITSQSATKNLPGRDRFLKRRASRILNRIINNGFFHLDRDLSGNYPIRNFVPAVIGEWELTSPKDWIAKYGDQPVAFETLVELPRTGECYRRAGWRRVGRTKGMTCRRVAGRSTDGWSGRRIWTRGRPKLVFMKWIAV
jgi:hypothetical protein